MKKSFLFLMLMFGLLNAQELSVGFNYSGLISAANYESISLYTLETDIEFIKNKLSVGLAASVSDSRITKTFIKNPPPDHPFEYSFKLGILTKYYPIFYQNGSFTLKPYIGVELGLYSTNHVETYLNMPSGCSELYSFDSRNDFYTNFSLGAIIFPEQALSFVFGIRYQINNPTLKYEKPNCDEYDSPTTEPATKYTEEVNLTLFVWSAGFKINF